MTDMRFHSSKIVNMARIQVDLFSFIIQFVFLLQEFVLYIGFIFIQIKKKFKMPQ